MNVSAPVLFLIAALICTSGCTTTDTARVPVTTAPASDILVVDALLPLTGSYASFGHMSEASLMVAEEDINQYYTTLGLPSRVKVVVHNTGSDPATALRLVRQVHDEGRRLVVGHMTSAEIAGIRDYTDRNGMVILDAGSTSPDLAIPGDSIYRLISDDSAQGRVMGAWLEQNNVRAIVPIQRGDIWGDGLLNATQTAFAERQGKTARAVRYDPGTTDFTPSITALDIRTGEAIATYGADGTAVYVIGFDETAAILNESSARQNLSRVRWFGCDGNTGISSLAGTGPAARFAARVNLSGTVWGIARINPSSGVQDRIRERLGYPPASGPVALYDALWVVKNVYSEIPADSDQARIATALVRHLDTYDGESMSLEPNVAGDRLLASYDVLQVTGGVMGSTWNKTAHIITWPDGREEITIFH